MEHSVHRRGRRGMVDPHSNPRTGLARQLSGWTNRLPAQLPGRMGDGLRRDRKYVGPYQLFPTGLSSRYRVQLLGETPLGAQRDSSMTP